MKDNNQTTLDTALTLLSEHKDQVKKLENELAEAKKNQVPLNELLIVCRECAKIYKQTNPKNAMQLELMAKACNQLAEIMNIARSYRELAEHNLKHKDDSHIFNTETLYYNIIKIDKLIVSPWLMLTAVLEQYPRYETKFKHLHERAIAPEQKYVKKP